MADPETADLLPLFIRNSPDFGQLRKALRAMGKRVEARQRRVQTELRALNKWVIENGTDVTNPADHTDLGDQAAKAVGAVRKTPGDSEQEGAGGAPDTFRWTDVDPPQEDETEAHRKAGNPRDLPSARLGQGLSSLLGPATAEATSELPSSTWTGRVTPREQARIVLSLAPAALEGVRGLLVEHEHPLHNHPPEAIAKDEIEALRKLHQALGDLIALAERGDPVSEALNRVGRLRDRLFKFAAETGELSVAGLKPLLACQPAAWGTYALLGLISAPATFATFGPAAALAIGAGYFGLDVARQPKA